MDIKSKVSAFYVVIAFMFLLAGCKKVHEISYVEDFNITQPEIIADFKEVHQIVKKNYSFFQHKGIDPDYLYSEFYSQIQSARNGEEYIRLLLQYFSRLENSHTNLVLRRYEINNFARLIDDRLFLSYVGDETFLHNGIQVKDEIVAVNQTPVMEWLNQESSFIGASTTVSSFESARINVFQSFFPGDRHYLISTDEGLKEISVVFRRPERVTGASSANTPRPLVDASIISDRIGYISIAAMQDRAQREFFDAFAQVKNKSYLIVDLRNNIGGNSPVSEKIATHLLKHDHEACVSKKTLSPGKDAYKGTLFLLIGGLTFSAAESFVIDLKEGAQAILVGKPTAGDTGSRPRFFKTNNNLRFRLATQQPYVSAGGFPMEGKSIEPHYYVEQSFDDFFHDRDTALDFIIDMIEQGKY